MNRERIFLFEDGSWEFAEMCTPEYTDSLPRHKEIVIGPNWTDREITQMIDEYYNVNYID
jgi:hypothetical protein